ncbi:MAG TPA: hypothetical protein PKY87_12845 [Terricaulis sp.]|nr:hypothetical protein [Terricaulis sp.]
MVYVQITFNPWDQRSYTYSYDGDAPLAVGDRVEVETKRGHAAVEVVGVIAERPASIPAHVEIKPISRVILSGDQP